MGPPPELFDNSLEGAGYLPYEAHHPLFSGDLISTSGATTPSLKRASGHVAERRWVLVRSSDYVVHGECVPSTKTIGDWWSLPERNEYVSVRGESRLIGSFLDAAYSVVKIEIISSQNSPGRCIAR